MGGGFWGLATSLAVLHILLTTGSYNYAPGPHTFAICQIECRFVNKTARSSPQLSTEKANPNKEASRRKVCTAAGSSRRLSGPPEGTNYHPVTDSS